MGVAGKGKIVVALGKVLARGQVTLPSEVRRLADVRAGDTLSFRVRGPGSIEIRVLPRMRLSEALARYRISEAVDDAADREAWQSAAEKDVLGGSDA